MLFVQVKRFQFYSGYYSFYLKFIFIPPNNFANKLYKIASQIPVKNPVAPNIRGIPIRAPKASSVP